MAQLTASLYRRLGAFDFATEETSPGGTAGNGDDDQFDGRGGFEECCVANRAVGSGGVAQKAVRLATDAAYRAAVSSAIIRLSPRLFEDAEAVREWEGFLRAAAAVAAAGG